MKFRSYQKSDLQDIQSLLKNAGLPHSDIEDSKMNIELVEDDGCIVGIGALEEYGRVGLFRSLVVVPSKRNRHLGSKIYKHIEEKAMNSGVKELYLLTESASEYFLNLGFAEVEKTAVPIDIKNTSQFTSLCPDSALVMRKHI